MVPVTVPGVTDAEKVTDCPKADGLSEEASATLVAAWTFWVTMAEEGPATSPSPANTAWIVCVPGVRLEVENCAEPLANCTVPRPVVPSRNWITSLADAGETEAVKVTGEPGKEGFELEVSTTVATGPGGLPVTANW